MASPSPMLMTTFFSVGASNRFLKENRFINSGITESL
jgi:hypothetical protein